MTDLDVRLRLRLLNELSRPSREAEGDLKKLKKASEQLGSTKSGNALAHDIATIGKNASDAKGKIHGIGAEAEQLRRAIGLVDNGAFDGLKAKADSAKQAISDIGREAGELKSKIGHVDDNAFSGLKQDAKAAEAAVKQIGTAADIAQTKLDSVELAPGRGYRRVTAKATLGRSGGMFGEALEGAIDRSGLDAYIPYAAGGATGAYMVGAAPVAAAAVAGAAINAAAGDEITSDQLRTLGGYSEAEQKSYDEMMKRIGANRGIGTKGAMGIFGRLMAGGLSAEDAVARTDAAAVFAGATQATGEDAANTTVALKDNMNISATDLPRAYDAMTVGGTFGRFETSDMARNYPSILARMGSLGSSGLRGLQIATAMAQSIMKRSGTSDEASTTFKAMLTDMVSPDVADRAEDYGIDIYKVKDQAALSGADPVLATLKVLREKLGGNEKKMRDVFRNSTAFQGYDSIFQDWDWIAAMIGEMQKADGVVSKNYDGATDNFNSQRDRVMATIGGNVKSMAEPALKPLTSAMRGIADGAAAEREQPGRGMAGTATGITGWLSKMFLSGDARQKFLWGKAAQPGFSLKDQMGIDLRPSAEQSMQGYNESLATEGDKAVGIAQEKAAAIRDSLSFTATPTIAPTFLPPTPAPRPSMPKDEHSALQAPTSVKVAQYFPGGNARLAAMRAQREQNRSVRMATARSLSDTGGKIA